MNGDTTYFRCLTDKKDNTMMKNNKNHNIL